MPTANVVALAVTVLYGLTVALLAVADSPATSTVAIVGGLVLGAMWALLGVLRGRARRT